MFPVSPDTCDDADIAFCILVLDKRATSSTRRLDESTKMICIILVAGHAFLLEEEIKVRKTCQIGAHSKLLWGTSG